MMSMPIEDRGGLWIAHPRTRYGHLELFCGEGDHPDVKVLLLAEQFLGGAIDHLAAVRRSAFTLPKLWRPIRLAINNAGRLGIQFRHRVTGRQEGMFFADEHSEFRMLLGDVTVEDGDEDRLTKRGDA